MTELPKDGPVTFRAIRDGQTTRDAQPPRRPLPLAIDQRTLGVMLIVWSLISVVDDVTSIQWNFFPPAPPGSHSALLQPFLAGTPFPWLWYFLLGPAILAISALVVLAGGILMGMERRPGQGIAAAGFLLALGAEVVSLISELTSLRAPFHLPWQWAVNSASSALLMLGALCVVMAAKRNRRTSVPDPAEPSAP